MEKVNPHLTVHIAKGLNQLDDLVTVIGKFLALDLDYRLWAIIKQSRIILMTDDPHLATHLRFQQQTLMRYLSKHLKTKITGMHIKLISLPLARVGQKTRRPQMSDNTADTLRSISTGIEDDELRKTLQRLINTTSRSSHD